MQPMGRVPSRLPSKTDCHPHDGRVNWWEAEMANDENKKGERQKAKLDLRQYKGLCQK
ncbi:hypothetical protein KAR91_41955 [Candidatus Pacearchaeota archaeon]|nr:hypothetical protein [Candidatus Pacearchaeota archaeon]